MHITKKQLSGRKTHSFTFLFLSTISVAGCGEGLAPEELSAELHPLVAAEAESTFTFDTAHGIRRFPRVPITAQMAARAKDPIAPSAPLPLTVPASGSIRAAMTAVKDQGARGTCATFSSVALTERYVGGDLSEQCIVREIGGNDGAWPTTRFALLATRGAVSETSCRYHATDQLANIPAPYSYDTLAANSGTHSALEYRALSESSTSAEAMNHIKEAVAQGHPTTANFIIVDNTRWDDTSDTRIDLPAALKCAGVSITDPNVQCPGHSVVIVGYDDADSSFLIKNSYGPRWKDAGYGRLSYAYFQRLAYGPLEGLRQKLKPMPPLRGDFNGDGRSDLVITTASGSFVYLGKSDGTFIPDVYKRPDLPLGQVDFTPGDFNGDGRTDLVITTASGSFVYQGRADGTFTPNVYVRTDLKLGHVRHTPGDFNGDGKADLMITTLSGSYLYLGRADGSFTPNVYVRTDLKLGQVGYTPGDFNGDGRTDLMITTASGSFEYRGRADGQFDANVWTRTDLPLGAVQYTAGDFSGDGRTDLLITTASGSFEYLGRADSQFDATAWIRSDLPLGKVEYVAGDLSGDRKSDLVITTALGSYVYLGATTGFLADRYVRNDLPLGQVSFFPSDFNGDGRGDLMITTASGSFVYLGRADGTLTPDVYVRSDLPLFAVEYF